MKNKRERINQNFCFMRPMDSIGTKDYKDGTMGSTDTIAST